MALHGVTIYAMERFEVGRRINAGGSGLLRRGLVPHLRLQLLEEVLDYDQLARLLDTAIPNHHEPLIVGRYIVLGVTAVAAANPNEREQRPWFPVHNGGRWLVKYGYYFTM